jgi:hypothetical protein
VSFLSCFGVLVDVLLGEFDAGLRSDGLQLGGC